MSRPQPSRAQLSRHSAPHPLYATRLGTLLECFRQYGWPDARFLPRTLKLLLVTTLRTPLHQLEARRVRARVQAQKFAAPPVFIIGHWRSGTTHLHQLLSQDPQFGVVSLMQASFPLDFLTTYQQGRPLARFLPATRLVDAMPVSLDSPWEEEMAMACFGALSFFHAFFFPRAGRRIYRAAVHFDGITSAQIEAWWKNYDYFLRKVQCAQPDRRLLLKNPANSARIAGLRARFPGAKFIHIHRHPQEVFASTIFLHRKLQEIWGLQASDASQLSKTVLANYADLMVACLEQTHGMSPSELVEVSLTNLETNPLPTLQVIYRQLEVDGFEEAEPLFTNYLNGIGVFTKNRLSSSDEERAAVRSTLSGLFERWDYE